jgi:hypothetical protein
VTLLQQPRFTYLGCGLHTLPPVQTDSNLRARRLLQRVGEDERSGSVGEEECSGSVGEAEQGVLDHFGHRWVNPVLAAGYVGRGLGKTHRLNQRLDQ